jgi:hypothetical protein
MENASCESDAALSDEEVIPEIGELASDVIQEKPSLLWRSSPSQLLQ